MTLRRGPFTTTDVAVALLFLVLGVVLMIPSDDQPSSALALIAFLAVTAPVLWRRQAPLPAVAVTVGALLVHVAAFGDMIRCGVVFPLAFVLAYASGFRLSLPSALAGLAMTIVAVVVVGFTDTQLADTDFIPFTVMTAVAWGIGRFARSRSRMVDELEVRTTELRTARDERARIEVATDRERLSGELDALLHRRLGELARMADAGAAGTAPDATATLVDIEQESRRTLEEMRAVVGTLRSDDGHAPVSPQPTLTHLEALLVRAKGADARLGVAGSPRALPPGVELSAYRIVEHLLDMLENAPGVTVEVTFGDDALELAVSGPARRRASAALDRARERVELHRGTLRATTRGGRSEAIAKLPVMAAP
ncbi:MAG: hypothetical protein WKF94_05550 [Solirubrobacteraceae bacterium]